MTGEVYLMDAFFNELERAGLSVIRSDFEHELSDESHLRGHAEGIVRARHEADVVALLRSSAKWRVPVTVTAGKTSLTGAATPLGGIVCDIKALDAVAPNDPTRVGPGIIVSRYKEIVEAAGLFYPPDPTSQESCTLGGNVATNASGALSYQYGPTRDYIRGLRVVIPDGRVIDVERGDVVSSRGRFVVPPLLMQPAGGSELVIPVPRLNVPVWSECKNAAGLFSAEPMDLVDLFIGCEGILGVVTEVRTKLLPPRKSFFSLMLSIPTMETALGLVHLLDGLMRFHRDKATSKATDIAEQPAKLCHSCAVPPPERFSAVAPSCMEWIGASLGRFLSSERARRLEGYAGCLYVEQEYGDDPHEALSQWATLVEAVNRGGSDRLGIIETEVALDPTRIRGMRKDREAVPERLTESIRPGMVKVGLDFAVPMRHLERLAALYDYAFQGLDAYVFGHIGNAHIHANLLPEKDTELQHCRDLVKRLAREVCALGGSVSAEHGIGKLKHELLEIMIGLEGIGEIRRVKEALDPGYLLNRGTMVGYSP
ncbi:MAG: FAD-binding oxidoreductase [Desulfomonile sp.]|nr:FAD-binding oxidoreductase [Desulfomonile sp.]